MQIADTSWRDDALRRSAVAFDQPQNTSVPARRPATDPLSGDAERLAVLPQSEAQRPINSADGDLAKRFNQNHAALAARKRLILATQDILARGRAVSLPAPIHLPEHITNPARFIIAAARQTHDVAAITIPKVLLHAGAMARASSRVAAAAAAGLPHAINLDRLAVEAVRSEIVLANQRIRAMERDYRQRLQMAQARITKLTVRQIYAVAKVAPPAAVSPVLDKKLVSPANPVIALPLPPAVKVVVASIARPGQASASLAQSAGLLPISAKTPPEVAPVQQASLAPEQSAPPVLLAQPKSRAKRAAAKPEKFDLTGLREAVTAFKKGDMDNGRAHVKRTRDPVARAAAQWAQVRLQPRKAGYSRIMAFVDAHPNWPKRKWLQHRAEQSLFIDRPARKYVSGYLKSYTPVSAIGQLAKARHLLAQGNKKQAAQVVSAAWREGKFNTWLQRIFIKEFRKQLSAEDFAYRSAKLFYRERYSQSLRVGGRGGKAVYALAAARVAVGRGGSPTKFGAKLTRKMRRDPSWKFAQALRLRRAGKADAAGKMMLSVKSTASEMIDGKAWWEERRMIARRLLDADKPKLAYAVAAGHGFAGSKVAASNRRSIANAEFYAGWLALRFAKKPARALKHFSVAEAKAERPALRSRAAYWLGRAVEKGPKPEGADQHYADAAQYSSTYYGQLALARLKGTTQVPLQRAASVAQGADRLLPVRVVDALARIDADRLAQQLAFGLAREVKDKTQIAAVAAVMKRQKDARSTLVVGKLASYRGVQLDDVAFPDFGIPKYTALSDSAQRSMVYAIARQESAFRAKAKSHAGAKGLMQMLTSTARVTARRKGVPFSPDRLISDPAFNAQLGAAHLGDLMREHPGSLTLVFAAYNAGGGRVNQWVKAYGDPRKAGVDPIDWVERIPIAETRHYVQRVTENLGVYRSLLGRGGPPHPAASQFRAIAAAW